MIKVIFAVWTILMTKECRCAVRICWTQWFNRGDPCGVGDFETLQDLRQENPGKICDAPIAIEATTVSGIPASQTGQTIQNYDTTVGFACVNSKNKQCLDYKVRFQCPPSFCPGCWTQWFDRDDPGGVGDFETLRDLRQENPGEICDAPIAIEATTLSGIPASQTGQTIQNYDTTVGFACVNCQNKQLCLDYQVRFQCPSSFCPA